MELFTLYYFDTTSIKLQRETSERKLQRETSERQRREREKELGTSFQGNQA